MNLFLIFFYLSSSPLKFVGKKMLCSEYSMQLNASRIKVLQAQDDVVNSMKESASKELMRVCEDRNTYKKLLKALIAQVINICIRMFGISWKSSY